MSISVANLFFLLAIQQVFAYSIGAIFGIVNVFFRDIREFLSVFMTIWFWMTPIVWVPSIAPGWLQNIQKEINPYFWFIDEYREIFLYGNNSGVEKILFLTAISLIILLASIFFMNFVEKEIRDYL